METWLIYLCSIGYSVEEYSGLPYKERVAIQEDFWREML